MQPGSNWGLFYKLEEGRPREFREVRQVDAAVWVFEGKAGTWGERKVVECGSVAEARARFQATCAESSAGGWVLTREGTYDPTSFDFEALRREIRDGARQAFTAVRSAHPGERVNSYALVTDESAMTIGHVAASAETLQQTEDPDEYRFMPDEWTLEEGGEFLDVAYRLILPRHQDLPFQLEFREFRDGVFEAGVRALEELVEEGFFGSETERDDVLVLFHVTDADDLDDVVARLNTPAMTARYREWWDSWN